MILIQLRVQRADLALPVGIVQRVVDGGRRNAKPRCRHAIDVQMQRASARLLVGGHILQFRQLLQLRDKLVGPLIQFVDVRIFERVLVLRTAHAIIHRDVLHRLHVQVHAGHLREIGLQPANHIGGAHVALLDRHQVDGDAAAVQRGVDAVGADERRKALHRRDPAE